MSASHGGELRGAVIGFGLAGSVFHAPLIASTPGLTVAAVATGNEERAAQARRSHPEAQVLADADALFARAAEFDFTVIASPNESHVPLASRAIDAGLAVVVDKPLAPDAVAAQDLVLDAADAGVPLTVFLNRRWDSDQLTIAKLIADDALGTITRHESRFERWRPALAEDGAWREDTPPEQGGGILLDLGPHLVDQAIQMHGPVQSVYAEIEHRRRGAGDDDAFLALAHESGVESHIWVSLVAASPGPRRRLLGDGGAYVVQGLDSQESALREGRLPGEAGWGDEPEAAWGELVTSGGARTIPTLPGDWPAFYAGFECSLREGAPLPIDPAEAVAGLRVLDAARRSAAGGTVERLPG